MRPSSFSGTKDESTKGHPQTGQNVARSLLPHAPTLRSHCVRAAHYPQFATPSRPGLLIAMARYDDLTKDQLVALLKSRGAEFVGPDAGILACGYEGLGRLAAVTEIASRALAKCGEAKPDQRTKKSVRSTFPMLPNSIFG